MARLDVWLWSVRLFKTRSQATAACRSGHVRVNGNPTKAAYDLKIADLVTIREPGWQRNFKVRKLISKRVGAALAVECYQDLSDPRPAYLSSATARRDRGTGRPTKKDRRAIDALRGRDSY